jgi:hypothetical protein
MGAIDGAMVGQIVGGQIGGRSIAFWQSGSICPSSALADTLSISPANTK